MVTPLIGAVESLRARDPAHRLLPGTRERRAEVAILSFIGVPIVDSGVAAHVNRTIPRRYGRREHRTIVDLGIGWGGIETLRDSQTGTGVVTTGRAAR